MKQITIRTSDDALVEQFRAVCKECGQSVQGMILDLMRDMVNGMADDAAKPAGKGK